MFILENSNELNIVAIKNSKRQLLSVAKKVRKTKTECETNCLQALEINWLKGLFHQELDSHNIGNTYVNYASSQFG